MEKRVRLNVGGRTFCTLGSTLLTVPGTLLARLNPRHETYDPSTGEYFFDRNPELFGPVLDYYRTGELHFSHCLCGPIIKRELDFWGIDETVISACCWKAYTTYAEEKKTIDELDRALYEPSSLEGPLPCCPDGLTGGVEDDGGDERLAQAWNTQRRHSWLAQFKHKLWQFLDKPTSSKAAQAWAIIFFMLILMSIAVVILETHPDFRVPRNMSDTQLEQFPGNANSTKYQLYITTELHPALQFVDLGCICVFALELTIRFLVSPSKLRFFKSFFNIIDIVCVIPLLIVTLLQQIDSDFWNNGSFIVIITYLSLTSVLRVFRLFKLARHYKGLKILQLAVRSSLGELVLLVLLIFMGMLIFSTLIYFAEFEIEDTFPNIPIGFWWSIITMTTIGYGDYTPKGNWGFLVGAVCGISGMLITGLPIPIIASNFNHYYNHAHLCKKIAEKTNKRHDAWKDPNISKSTVNQSIDNETHSALSHSDIYSGGNASGQSVLSIPSPTTGRIKPKSKQRLKFRDNHSNQELQITSRSVSALQDVTSDELESIEMSANGISTTDQFTRMKSRSKVYPKM